MGGVVQASSPASSGGVSPPVPTRGETPRELAGGTPAVPRRNPMLAGGLGALGWRSASSRRRLRSSMPLRGRAFCGAAIRGRRSLGRPCPRLISCGVPPGQDASQPTSSAIPSRPDGRAEGRGDATGMKSGARGSERMGSGTASEGPGTRMADHEFIPKYTNCKYSYPRGLGTVNSILCQAVGGEDKTGLSLGSSGAGGSNAEGRM